MSMPPDPEPRIKLRTCRAERANMRQVCQVLLIREGALRLLDDLDEAEAELERLYKELDDARTSEWEAQMGEDL